MISFNGTLLHTQDMDRREYFSIHIVSIFLFVINLGFRPSSMKKNALVPWSKTLISSLPTSLLIEIGIPIKFTISIWIEKSPTVLLSPIIINKCVKSSPTSLLPGWNSQSYTSMFLKNKAILFLTHFCNGLTRLAIARYSNTPQSMLYF